MQSVPTLNEWKSMPESERIKILKRWTPYSKDAQPLLNDIAEEFKREYGHLRGLGLAINGIGDYHGSIVIAGTCQFVFDRRLIPHNYLGLPIQLFDINIPKDFERFKGFFWAPENYEYFVDHHIEKIRKELGNPEMSRYEMLSALCGMDFDKYIEICRSSNQKYTKK